MLRLVSMTGLVLYAGITSFGQLKKFYTVGGSQEYDTIDFHLKATATNCLISKDASNSDPLTIYGNPNLDKINPSFRNRIAGKTYFANLALDEYESSDFSNSFAMAVSGSVDENDLWKINFIENKIYKLDLHYGFGNADVNLTGASVKNLKVKSGSADISVGFDKGSLNGVAMDTFFVKSDFGNVIAREMELARARKVITKVGFGNVLLDFDGVSVSRCDIDASVGAGNLTIVLPQSVDGTPVLIKIKDSPLCAVKLVDGFEEVEDNTYVNMYYNVHADNLLRFDIDVALGMVQFKYSN